MTNIHHLMQKGIPYSLLTARIARKMKDQKRDTFTIRDFPDVDPVEWRAAIQKLKAVGLVKKKGTIYDRGSMVVVYQEDGLVEKFERWYKRHKKDFNQFLFKSGKWIK